MTGAEIVFKVLEDQSVQHIFGYPGGAVLPIYDELKTRQYAKRQFTWARGHMKSWDMIYSPNINDLFKIAINKIS